MLQGTAILVALFSTSLAPSHEPSHEGISPKTNMGILLAETNALRITPGQNDFTTLSTSTDVVPTSSPIISGEVSTTVGSYLGQCIASATVGQSPGDVISYTIYQYSDMITDATPSSTVLSPLSL